MQENRLLLQEYQFFKTVVLFLGLREIDRIREYDGKLEWHNMSFPAKTDIFHIHISVVDK